jgi:hypothetical protein
MKEIPFTQEPGDQKCFYAALSNLLMKEVEPPETIVGWTNGSLDQRYRLASEGRLGLEVLAYVPPVGKALNFSDHVLPILYGMTAHKESEVFFRVKLFTLCLNKKDPQQQHACLLFTKNNGVGKEPTHVWLDPSEKEVKRFETNIGFVQFSLSLYIYGIYEVTQDSPLWCKPCFVEDYPFLN